jgi:hypothetical protein
MNFCNFIALKIMSNSYIKVDDLHPLVSNNLLNFQVKQLIF